MSVDSKKFTDTLRLGTDECSPCARTDRNVAAIKYCVECEENLCPTCLNDHNKFAKMRVHQITDNLSSRTGPRKDLPTQRCDRHGGKLIDVYCTTHDVVGCSTCFNVEHGYFEGICYIPDMTLGMLRSWEISDLETKVAQLLARLDNLKRQKQVYLNQLQEEKDKLLKEIKVLRQKLNEKLDEMEQTLVNEVNTKLATRIRDVRKDLDVISKEQLSLEERQKSVQGAKNANNTEQFVHLKMGQSLVQEHERTFRSISTGPTAVKMQVIPNSNIATLLQTDDIALGSISEIPIPKSTTYDRDVNVRLPSDKGKCYISDICLTLNGDFALADHSNWRIKKLDASRTVTKYTDLPDYPVGLCEVDNKRLVVTLYNKKVLILFQYPMSLGKSFSVGDICRSIDCHNALLYVCSGGKRESKESPGRTTWVETY